MKMIELALIQPFHEDFWKCMNAYISMLLSLMMTQDLFLEKKRETSKKEGYGEQMKQLRSNWSHWINVMIKSFYCSKAL